MFGELHSSVRAHIDESGVLTASIVLPDETYHIEVRICIPFVSTMKYYLSFFVALLAPHPQSL